MTPSVEHAASVPADDRATPGGATTDLAAAFERVASLRRSAYAYLPDAVPSAIVQRAIRLAMLGPNHHRTRPWRFFVYADGGRAPLVAAYEAAAARLGRDPAKARQRALDAPVMIVVACIPATANPRVKSGEEEFAVAAAVENLLLALASEGVASLITTGDFAESPEVHALVGLHEGPGRIMCVINAGYRDPRRSIPPRPEADPATFTQWFNTA